jgi:hypothetical protein
MRSWEPLTLEQVRDRIPKDTSPGYPLNIKRYTKGESLDLDWDWILQQNPLKRDFVDQFTLKDELRPEEKVLQGKTRSIVVCDMVNNLHYGRFIYPLLDYFVHCCMKSNSTLGFSPWYGNTDKLFRKMDKFPNSFCADYSEFDTHRSYSLERYSYIFDQSLLNCSGSDLILLAHLQQCATTSWCLVAGKMFLKTHGQSSGRVDTSYANTKVNCLREWCLLIDVHSKIFNCSYDFSFMFIKDCRDANYISSQNGDDWWYTCSDSWAMWFNPHSILPSCQDLGFKLTFSSNLPIHNLDAVYLSITFTTYKGVVVPVFNLDRYASTVLLRSKHKPDVKMDQALAGRILSWNTPWFLVYDSYCIQLAHTYPYDWELRSTAYKSEYEIEIMYTGFETGCITDMPVLKNSNLIYSNVVNSNSQSTTKKCPQGLSF